MPAVAYLPGLSYFSSLPGLIPTGFSIPRSLFSSIIPQSPLPPNKRTLPGSGRSSVVPRNESLPQKGTLLQKSSAANAIIRFSFRFQKTKLVPVGDIISPNPQSTINNQKWDYSFHIRFF
jgi:hypothetical protein